MKTVTVTGLVQEPAPRLESHACYVAHAMWVALPIRGEALHAR